LGVNRTLCDNLSVIAFLGLSADIVLDFGQSVSDTHLSSTHSLHLSRIGCLR